MAGHHCPACPSLITLVVDSRSADGGLRRRRQCPACKHRFTTYELTEARIARLSRAANDLEQVKQILREP